MTKLLDACIAVTRNVLSFRGLLLGFLSVSAK